MSWFGFPFKVVLMSVWLVTAVVTGGLLYIAENRLQGKNDPDQAYERPGFVFDSTRKVVNVGGTELPDENKPLVVFFVRNLNGEALFHDVSHQACIAHLADMIVVSNDGSTPLIMNGIDAVITKNAENLADQLLTREPLDKKFPVGYVIVGKDGYVKYQTLDGGFQHRGEEVLILLEDVK